MITGTPMSKNQPTAHMKKAGVDSVIRTDNGMTPVNPPIALENHIQAKGSRKNAAVSRARIPAPLKYAATM